MFNAAGGVQEDLPWDLFCLAGPASLEVLTVPVDRMHSVSVALYH